MNASDVLWQYREAFARGFFVTLELVVLAGLIGTFVGFLLEWLCSLFEGPVRAGVDGVAFAVSAIPALVILFWLYYPAQSLLGVSVSPFLTALAALTLIATFSVYRIIADARRDFPQQYVTTALVLGLNKAQILRYIQMPLLIRAALPRWVDLLVVLLQTSVFASLISVEEVFRVSQRINSVIYRPVIIYSAMAVLFLVAAGSGMYLAKYLRARFHRDFSER